jgi:hypothetical protein
MEFRAYLAVVFEKGDLSFVLSWSDRWSGGAPTERPNSSPAGRGRQPTERIQNRQRRTLDWSTMCENIMNHKTPRASGRTISAAAVIASILFCTSVFQPSQANAEKTDNPPAASSEVQKPPADKTEPVTPEYREVKKIEIPKTADMTGHWRAIAYEANVEVLSDTDFPAKLCFYSNDEEATQRCFKGIAARKDGTWNCQFVQDLSVTPIFQKKYPQEGVLFVSLSHHGGSGGLSLITLWVFNEQAKKFVNILPVVTITNLGEYKILHDRGDELDGTLVIADFIWAKGEAHFDEHKYEIRVYRYNRDANIFEKVGSFVTEDKYPDTEEKYDIIRHEMKKIEYILSKK